MTADEPTDAGPRVPLGQLGQTDQRVLSGCATAGDDDMLAGVPRRGLGLRQVGDAVEDAVGVLGLAGGGVPVAAERVGCAPRAGGVDHGARGQHLVVPVRRDVDAERHLVAAEGDQAVTSGAGDADDAVAVPDLDARLVGEQLGQRGEVLLNPLMSGRVRRGLGARPPVLGEQLLGDRVDELGPWREEPDVPPLADGSPGPSPDSTTMVASPRDRAVGGRGQTGGAGPTTTSGLLMGLP